MILTVPALVGLISACSDHRGTNQADTLSDAAAAESAKVLAAMSQAQKTHMTLTTTGDQQFDGPMDARASCTYSESNGEQLIQVEGFARDAQLSFSIVAPREGDVRVTSLGNQRGPRVTNLNVGVGSQHYSGGAGQARIIDPLGRSGSLTASHFVRAEGSGKGHRKHGATLSVKVFWECE